MTLFRQGIKRGMKGGRERERTQEAASVHTRAGSTLNGFVRCKIYNPGSGDNYRGSRRCNLIIPRVVYFRARNSGTWGGEG